MAQDGAGKNEGCARPRIPTMSAEVRADNPYSRLMALQRMGVVRDYQKITKKAVVLVGVGGVGSVAAEMLVRCGIGKLILFDFDSVELSNMNRLFFTPKDVGLTKVEAARRTLSFVNPDVELEAHNANICQEFDLFLSRILNGKDSMQQRQREEHREAEHGCDAHRGLDCPGEWPVDLVLSCVDNYAARITISQACNEAALRFVEPSMVWSTAAVLSAGMEMRPQKLDSCVDVYIHMHAWFDGLAFCPASFAFQEFRGSTAGFLKIERQMRRDELGWFEEFPVQCAPPYVVATKEDENSIKREGVCAASLPTTMGVTAGFLVQNALKFLLGFGRPSTFVGWESLQDYFTSLCLRPNDQCADAWCCKRQKEVQGKGLTLEDYLPRAHEGSAKEGPLHEDNPFGITLVDDGEQHESGRAGSHAGPETKLPACASSLDELAAKLKSLQS